MPRKWHIKINHELFFFSFDVRLLISPYDRLKGTLSYLHLKINIFFYLNGEPDRT